MCWLVASGKFRTVRVQFLLAGHAKFEPDTLFANLSKNVKGRDILKVPDDLEEAAHSVARKVNIQAFVFHICSTD